MTKIWYLALATVVVIGAFVAGAWVTWSASGKGQLQVARKVLYWVDPMHPTYKADKPGIAPDCGMQLEPVYADEIGQPTVPGALKVSEDKRQLIGVRTGTVESRPIERTTRTVGRVSVDESRVYRLLAPSEGIVKQVFSFATGSIVRKNELLLTFFRGDYDFQGRLRPIGAAQVYFSELDTLDRLTKASASPEQVNAAIAAVQSAVNNLLNIGMSEFQIATLARTRKPTADIEIRSPVDGYVVARNVSALQPVDRGVEMFQIADLARVWILVDVFEQESRDLRPGAVVRVSQPYARSGPFEARVGNALPQFDPDSRTMKIRLEAGNADYSLRPGMFVDAELPVSLPSAVTVPVEAVVDSGTRRTVWVDRGNGYFEPRRVETGWRFDDRVEIVSGLSPGERIVTSGTFLLDSESRMKAAAMGIASAARDPVCHMDVDEGKSRASGKTAAYRGETYYFCSDDCKQKFQASPGQYVTGPSPASQREEIRHVNPIAHMKPIDLPAPEDPAASVAGAGAGRRPVAVDAASAALPPAAAVGSTPLPSPDPRATTSPSPSGRVRDLVCGADVDVPIALAQKLTSVYQGVTVYFSTPACKARFDLEPQKYIKK